MRRPRRVSPIANAFCCLTDTGSMSEAPPAPIILITGVMAAGKSTVAARLAARFERSVHLRGDLFRRMIVSGRVDMSADPTPEALAQLRLRYSLAATTAREYSWSGFTVAYQDVILGPMLPEAIALYAGLPLHVVVLCPDVGTVADREQARAKTGYGAMSIDALQRALEETPRLGLWLDTSDQTADETVAAILKDLQLARIQPD